MPSHFGCVFEENSVREITRKAPFSKCFPSHENETSPFSNSLKSVFGKLRFRDGLVSTVDLTVEIKLRFQISPAQCRQFEHGQKISIWNSYYSWPF